MKAAFVIFFLILFSMVSEIQASMTANPVTKVIYGVDNRLDVYESPNLLYKKLAESTAVKIYDTSLIDQGDSMLVVSKSFGVDYKMCAGARFIKQPTVGECSGFLVGNQYLLTAGHCIKDVQDCVDNYWIFGYGNITEEQSAFNIPKTEMYRCIELTEREADNNGSDYALVKLDRPVTNRAPLKYRTKGEILDNTKLVVIGHPSGLPTKIADGANVRQNSNKKFFQANLDTFVRNSGSAVFDAETGVVEGILVRGEADYDWDLDMGCQNPRVCPMNSCRGEDVVRVTNVKTLQQLNIK